MREVQHSVIFETEELIKTLVKWIDVLPESWEVEKYNVACWIESLKIDVIRRRKILKSNMGGTGK